jgi:excisionase family DNA binding protein
MGIGHGGNIEESEKILTTREVADYCKVSKRRIWTAVANGELEYLDFAPAGAKHSKTRRFTLRAVDRWLQSISSERAIKNIIL